MTSPVPEGTDEAVEAAARAEFEHDTGKSWPPTAVWGESIPSTRNAYATRAAAGLAAAAPHIAAKALREAAADLAGISSSVATTYQAVWLVDRADDIERAARAAGKDKTDGH